MNMAELLDQYGSTVRLSHLTLAGKGADPSNFIGQTLKVKVLDRDKRNHRLIFSRREVLIVLSRRNLAQVVDILADKADELRIFCRTDTVDIAYGMN